MQDVGNKIAKGAAWMVLFKLAERGLGLISTVILARLLLPSDFGLIAMAMAVIAALELLNAFSFDMALIQNPDAQRRHYDTAWTFNVLLGAASALILVALAVPAAGFYEEPRLEWVFYFLAFGTFISGLENIGVVDFRKQMQFNREFRFLLAKKVVAFSVTVPLAFILQNYWALVIGILTSKTAGTAFSYLMHPYRPRLSLAARAELFHFSKWLLINNLLFFLRLRSADFIIGKTSGPHALGLFTVAYEISNLPSTELVAPINRAVFPGYAKLSSDMDALRGSFLNVIAFALMFTLPVGAGIAAIAPQLVAVFLGEKWLEAVPLIQILAILGVITAVTTNAGYVYLALGQARITTVLSSLYVVLLLPLLIVLAMKYGAIGAAWAYLICAVAMLPVNYVVILRRLGVGSGQLLGVTWRPVAATLGMFAAATSTTGYLAAQPAAVQLAAGVLAGALSYCLIVLLLWLASSRPAGAERILLDKLQPRIPGLGRLLG